MIRSESCGLRWMRQLVIARPPTLSPAFRMRRCATATHLLLLCAVCVSLHLTVSHCVSLCLSVSLSLPRLSALLLCSPEEKSTHYMQYVYLLLYLLRPLYMEHLYVEFVCKCIYVYFTYILDGAGTFGAALRVRSVRSNAWCATRCAAT